MTIGAYWWLIKKKQHKDSLVLAAIAWYVETNKACLSGLLYIQL